MDYRPGFPALKAIRYLGYISIECWQGERALIVGDPETALPKTVDYLRNAWDAA